MGYHPLTDSVDILFRHCYIRSDTLTLSPQQHLTGRSTYDSDDQL